MADYGQLRAEIDADPAGLGYAGKTDAQISDLLNAVNISSGEILTVDSAEIYQAVDDPEAENLGGATPEIIARKKARLAEIYSISGPVDLGPNSRARKVLQQLFSGAAGLKTRAALVALLAKRQPPDISRAQQIGLGEGRTRESDVFKARALP